MNSTKAVETYYGGHLFRSRLEARWAMFFDMLEIPYLYEWDTHDVGHWYLPDFYLPTQKYWVEIKGPEPTTWERQKASRLASMLGETVYICQGDPYGAVIYEYVPLIQDEYDPNNLFSSDKASEIVSRIVLTSRYWKVSEVLNDWSVGWRTPHGLSVQITGIKDWYLEQREPSRYRRPKASDVELGIPSDYYSPQYGLRWEAARGETPRISSVTKVRVLDIMLYVDWCPRCKNLRLGPLHGKESSHTLDCIADSFWSIREIMDTFDLNYFDAVEKDLRKSKAQACRELNNAQVAARSARFENKTVVYVSGVSDGVVEVSRASAVPRIGLSV